MPEIVEDTDVWPVMLRLAECVETELAKRNLPGVITTLQPGSLPVIDYVGNGKECGELIINLGIAYPTQPFPQQDPLGTCNSEFGYEVHVSVFRCAPAMTGTSTNPKPPTPEAQTNAMRLQLADMQAMKAAIKCCLQGKNVYAILNYEPYDVTGLVMGGSYTVVVGGES